MTDAFKALPEKKFLDLAVETAKYILNYLIREDGSMIHSSKNGRASSDGFLEDYSFTIQAFVSLFEVTGDNHWLKKASDMAGYCLEKFFSPDDNLFFYLPKEKKSVIDNYFQTADNVIPAANSVMAINLFKLSYLMNNSDFLVLSRRMLQTVTSRFIGHPAGFANWGNLMIGLTEPVCEIAVCGPEAEEKTRIMQKKYLPGVIWSFSTGESEIAQLKNRFVRGKTLIYVCRDSTCNLPVENVEDALDQLESGKTNR